MSKWLDNTLGKAFPPATVFAGYIFFCAGLLAMLLNPLLGLAVAFLGAVVCFTQNGVEVDPDAKKFRSYSKLFGFRFGKWESLDPYSDVSVIRTKWTTTAFSRANTAMSTGENVYYDIFLLNAAHRVKLLVKRCADSEVAQKQAEIIAEQLGFQVQVFRPQISAQTRARRRR